MISFCLYLLALPSSSFFFFNDTATTEIYTLSLHDALPISSSRLVSRSQCSSPGATGISGMHSRRPRGDRQSSRLEATNPALLSSRDGYLLELTGWTKGIHVEHLEGAIAEGALDEFEADAHGSEAQGIRDARVAAEIKLAEPEHQQAVGREVAELVAVLDLQIRRRGRERQPDDRRRPGPASGYPGLSHQNNFSWPSGVGGRKRLQSRSGVSRLFSPNRRHATSKRFSTSSA